LVRHGHVLVNGKKVDIPSAQVSVGDKIEMRTSSREIVNVQMAWNMSESSGIPAWITRNNAEFSIIFDRLPTVQEINIPVNERLIVEYYSR
jgi:small subunit ribosomal protein S4